MAFQKGKVRTGGRQRGTSNKTTVAAKEAFQIAFDKIGGADALSDWASENQSEFYRLYSRLIPIENLTQVEPTISITEAARRIAFAMNAAIEQGKVVEGEYLEVLERLPNING